MKIDLNKDVPKHFLQLFKNQDRYLLLKGGAGSGKSVFVTKKLVYRSLKEANHKHLVLRKVKTDIEFSIFTEVVKRIEEWGLPNRVYYRIVKRPNLQVWLKDSIFLFSGLDDKERIKSISGITSITMEELSEFTEDDFNQVNLRLRGETPYYKQTIGMFNPIHENLWMKARFWDKESSIKTTLHQSSYKDNPYLDDGYRELLESYEEDNELYHTVYTLGDWGIVDKSNKFAHKFDKEKHVAPVEQNENLPIRLSFDFNLDPFAVSIYQRDGDNINIFDKIRLGDSDIEQVCDHILAEYGEQLFIVTGDVSGGSRSGVVRGKRSYWEVILQRLNINRNDRSRVKLRNKNIDLTESRILVNLVLNHPRIKVTIDPKCTELIDDFIYGKVDDRGILIKDRNKQKMDFLDTGRYIFDAEFPDIIRRFKSY